MIKQTYKEYVEKKKELFGDGEPIFVCPHCQTEQTPSDFEKYTELKGNKKQGYVAFSCIGRFTQRMGCDWTLGGLFKMHEKEVTDDEGKVHMLFKFSGE